MRKHGVIDCRADQYSLRERLHLIRCLSTWEASLYVFGQLTWESSIRPLSDDSSRDFKHISDQCRRHDVSLWAWIKPGDRRYVFHRSDRQALVDNALRYLELGAAGFYLLMDDMHPGNDSQLKVRAEDAEYHGELVAELSAALGDRFKAICGEHYHGRILNDHSEYWKLLTASLPKHVAITWTGPKIWNDTIRAESVPTIDWPILLFDNYFASDSDDPAKAPIYPYAGRDPALKNSVEYALVNPNNHYPWQFCALQTAMAFWRRPEDYAPEEAFKESIRQLGDMYMGDLKD